MWTPQGAAVKASVVLLANASAHISVERRKGVMKYFNRDLKHLAEEQYPKYSPFLFGEGFACKVKATADGIKALKGAQQKSFNFFGSGGSKYKSQGCCNQWVISKPSFQKTVFKRLYPATNHGQQQDYFTTKIVQQEPKQAKFTSLFRYFLACSSVQTTFPPLAQSGSSYSPDGAVASTPHRLSTLAGRTALHKTAWQKVTSDGLSAGIQSSAISVTPTRDHGNRLHSTSHLKTRW